jgi:hypothetical protein
MGTLATAARRSLGGPRSADASLVGAILATLPPLSNVERQAFREQFTAAQCEAAGVLANAGAVHRTALSWIRPIDRTLTRHPLLVRRYGRARYAWFLESVADLGEALERGRDAGEPGAAGARAERLRSLALRLREELIEAVSVLAGSDEDAGGRLAHAAGAADTPEQLAASLHALARLAEDWMDHEGPLTRALVASVDLSAADVESARAAAHALASTKNGGHDGHTDVPAANQAAGRVLLEMGLAMRVFERAHRWDHRVPHLVPGPETRAALTP